MTRWQIIAETFRRFAKVRRLKPADVVAGMALAAAGMPGLGNEHE